MSGTGHLPALRAVIAADQVPLPAPAQAMAAAIRARHGTAVRALVFYGSALREDGADRMLDFYVITDRYRSVYGRGWRALAAWLLPPNVHFCQIHDDSGQRLRSKYAIVSDAAFRRRTRGGSLESMLWARFTQPAVIVTGDPALRDDLRDTLALACQHFFHQTAPLLEGPLGPGDLWARGLQESYRTELRPEDPVARAQAIVARFPARYAQLSEILMPAGADGRHRPPAATPARRRACRFRWWLRRVTGKPRGALRVLKSAATFDGGLDYILEKVADHSGVRLDVSARERRHPVLCAPFIAWRLYRAGAFR